MFYMVKNSLEKMLKIPNELLGDAAYSPKEYLLRPYPARTINAERVKKNKPYSSARMCLVRICHSICQVASAYKEQWNIATDSLHN